MLRDGSTSALLPLPDTSTFTRTLVLVVLERSLAVPSTVVTDLLTTRMPLAPSTERLSRVLKSSVFLRSPRTVAEESPRTARDLDRIAVELHSKLYEEEEDDE